MSKSTFFGLHKLISKIKIKIKNYTILWTSFMPCLYFVSYFVHLHMYGGKWIYLNYVMLNWSRMCVNTNTMLHSVGYLFGKQASFVSHLQTRILIQRNETKRNPFKVSHRHRPPPFPQSLHFDAFWFCNLGRIFPSPHKQN